MITIDNDLQSRLKEEVLESNFDLDGDLVYLDNKSYYVNVVEDVYYLIDNEVR